MTVKELIEELNNYDDDQIVVMLDDDAHDNIIVHSITSVGTAYDAYICEDDDVVVLYS